MSRIIKESLPKTPQRPKKRSGAPRLPADDGAYRGTSSGRRCACGGGCPKCQEPLLVQAKVGAGAPGDRYEREADRVAGAIENPTSGFSHQGLAATEPGKPAPADDGLFSGGQALSGASLDFFQSRMGYDFSAVRVHTDPDAVAQAKALNARAFTYGNHLVFNKGEYAPQTPRGRKLLAHELTHVVQQAVGGNRVQRQEADSAEDDQPLTIASSEAIPGVDAAVRRQFPGLDRIRVRLRPRHVQTLDDTAFNREFIAGTSADSLEQILFNLFLSADVRPPARSLVAQILHHNGFRRHAFGSLRTQELRRFVQEGLRRNAFTYLDRMVSPSGRQAEQTITPGLLAALHVSGFTDTAAPRNRRQITLLDTASMHTLVHETIHFYVSHRFESFAAARTDASDLFLGVTTRQMLVEGFTEYFARQVTRNNPPFGQIDSGYDKETLAAHEVIATLGDADAQAAYFLGDRRQLRRLAWVINKVKDIYPLRFPSAWVPSNPP